MSLTICTKCLAHLQISSRGSSVPLRSFSTTKSQAAIGRQTKRNGKTGFRESTSARIKHEPRKVPKLPMIGERKALRKRIVLSNTNALEVQGMNDLSVNNMADDAQIGQVLALQGEMIDQLRHLKAFKPTQYWNMFRKPGTLMRRESIALGRTIVDIQTSLKEDRPRAVRRIVAGDRNTGKSLVLLQAMSMALLHKWVVIHVPEGQEYIIGHSPYAPMTASSSQRKYDPNEPIETSKETMYDQPKLTSELLNRVAKANTIVLKTLPLFQTSKITKSHNPKTLYDLALIGAENTSLSWEIWKTLWSELTSRPPSPESPKRPPVLLALDGINHWMRESKYYTADYKRVHAHQLAPIRNFIDILFNCSGAGALPNGGLILGATTTSNALSVPSFEILLRQLEALALGRGRNHSAFPLSGAYDRVDERVLSILDAGEGAGEGESEGEALEVQRLGGLDKYTETKGLLDYFARSGVLREATADAVVAEKWSLSGGGVVGELGRFAKRMRV